jgi:hypothetical protein
MSDEAATVESVLRERLAPRFGQVVSGVDQRLQALQRDVEDLELRVSPRESPSSTLDSQLLTRNSQPACDSDSRCRRRISAVVE